MKTYKVDFKDPTKPSETFKANRYEVNGPFILFLNSDKSTGRWDLMAVFSSDSISSVMLQSVGTAGCSIQDERPSF